MSIIDTVKENLFDFVADAEINIVGIKQGTAKFDFVVDKIVALVAGLLPFPDAIEKPILKPIIALLFQSSINETVALMNKFKQK